MVVEQSHGMVAKQSHRGDVGPRSEFGKTISGENAKGISGGLRREAAGTVQNRQAAADHNCAIDSRISSFG